MLRDYQQKTIDDLYQWFRDGNKGNPCIELPTGAGKSHIVAALCKDAVKNWPDTRVLMLTAQKELIEQNAEKMRQHWKGAPLGIYSASVGKRELGEPITFAGIQSLRGKARLIGFQDLVIVDECHMISHKNEGEYRKLLGELREINPNIRVIGLTATPYRLGHGLITDGDALFDDLIKPVTVLELVKHGYLAPLRSKKTDMSYDVSRVKKRGGEFIESDLQKAVDVDEITQSMVDEVIARAGDRKSWLFFCSGISHAEHVRDALICRGISAECVTGKTNKKDREQILDKFKTGKIQALTNANVLTTGFDAPNIDLIAMMRPTMSPSLYVQMAGRGMRLKEHTDHCLVLDFAGVVPMHGPITDVQPPKKSGSGSGEAPIKACPECFEIVHASAKVCQCGYEFPQQEKAPPVLHDVDIMGDGTQVMSVIKWRWSIHVSKASGKEMLKVTYYGKLSDKPITEYICIWHDGYAGLKAMNLMREICNMTKTDINDSGFINHLNNSEIVPKSIEYKKNGKFYNVMGREW